MTFETEIETSKEMETSISKLKHKPFNKKRIMKIDEINRKTYNTKLSSKLFLSLSRKISRVKKSIKHKQNKRKENDQFAHIEELQNIIKHQRKRIKELEKNEDKNLISMRKLSINRIEILTDSISKMEKMITNRLI